VTDRASGDPLVGGWRLRRWVATDAAGTEMLPMGAAADGYLGYTADGTMIAMMGSGERAPFDSDDVTGGTDAERARAFASFIAYAGRYEIAGDAVIHEVASSLFPNWIGTRQQRHWELDATGRYLTLTSPPILQDGATRVHRLTWERIGRDDPGP
jgi:hypothetical protein